jgi:hypothetical protein
VLVGGQLLVQKERNLVIVIPRAGTNTLSSTNALARSVLPNSPNAHLAAPGILSLYNDKFLMALDDTPMIGSPGASNIIVDLYDYNCPHCRLLHPMLVQVQRRLGDQLGIVCLPMPMDTNCNPFVPQGHPTFTNSCQYARLGLAVWRANREAYAEFDERMFQSEKPLSVDQAREYATQLVGAAELNANLTNQWIEQLILTACYLHHTNWASTGGDAMPQIIIGEAISVGAINSPNHLLVLLEKYLGIKPPPPAALMRRDNSVPQPKKQ